MDIKCYLAMTAAEYISATDIPDNLAWMACHFSLYGTGITNKPLSLPRGSMLILNDRIPPHRHNRKSIAEQMNQVIEENQCAFVLLDFQQKFNSETQEIAAYLTSNLSVPTGVSETYAADLDCAVFLNALPLRTPISKAVSMWKGRKLWLEIATDSEDVYISQDKSIIKHCDKVITDEHYKSTELHCKYTIEAEADTANITIQRDFNNLSELMLDASQSGVELFIGLYQQLATYNFHTKQ